MERRTFIQRGLAGAAVLGTAFAGAASAQAPDDDKDEIINLMEDIKTATQDGDIQRAGDLSEELDDILFYID